MGTFLLILFILFLLVNIGSRHNETNLSSNIDVLNLEKTKNLSNEYQSQILITNDKQKENEKQNIVSTKIENDIQLFLEKRKIEVLFHFTRINNLQSILIHGIYPRNKVNLVCPNVIINDINRFDNRLNTISISISFPNYKMFYKYRNLEQNTQYVLLGLNPSILYEKECLFCFTNAANKLISILPDSELEGIEALKKLFVRSNTADNNLPINFPTDPQAEVLVKDIIEPNYIKFIHTNDMSLVNTQVKFDSTYYVSRDYFLNHLNYRKSF